MVTAECHAHIFMDGVDYKKAAAAHENGPREDLILSLIHISEPTRP